MTSPSTLEDLVRDRLDHATADVPTGPDLSATISRGRRRRTLGHVRVVSCGLGVAALACGFAVGVVQHAGPAVPAASSPSAAGWVSGTSVDETLAQVVGDHVPHPGVVTALYPADWTGTAPLPDARAAQATEWQGHWQVTPAETLTVLMSQRPTDAPVGPPVCDGRVVAPTDIEPGGSLQVTTDSVRSASPSCTATRTARGTLVLTHDGTRATATFWRPADATVVTVTSTSSASDPADRRTTDAELEAVATDTRLSFPHASDPPAWPAGNGPGWPSGL